MAINKEIDFFAKISCEVKETFLKIQDALKNRETQLLRQIEVLQQHYKLSDSYDKCVKEVILNLNSENDVIDSIQNFGQINFSGLPYENQVFKIEDYQKPEIDHVSLYKYLEKTTPGNPKILNTIKIENKLNIINQEKENKQITTEEILNDFDKNELETVSNSMLQCIEKDDPKLCSHFTNNIELNENNHSKSDNSENKLLILENTKDVTDCDRNIFDDLIDSNSQCACSGNTSNINNKCICFSNKLQNIDYETSKKDNININNDKAFGQLNKISSKQPVQVQHWMKQIISETELEPTSNNAMEHSHIENIYKETKYVD